MNSLADRELIDKLVMASQAGVKIDLMCAASAA
jgi:polyphosphate kinase